MSALDLQVLQHALLKKRDEYGERGFYKELENLSGVTNVGRIARGLQKCTIDTWMKLCEADPDLPPPCLKKDIASGMYSEGDHNRLVQTSTYVEKGYNFSDEALELIKLIDEYESKAGIKKLLRKYRKVREDHKKA